MRCPSCGSPLGKPGDMCLLCGKRNVESAAVFFGDESAEIRYYLGSDEVATEEIPAYHFREEGREREVAFRNHVSLVGDAVYRKRPERIYAGGDRAAVRDLIRSVPVEVVRLGDDLFEEVVERLKGDGRPEEVELKPGKKFGGSHSSVVGGRAGMRKLLELAEHPNVKKVVPAAISAKGNRGGGEVEVSLNRVDDRGNVKALLKSGSTVQEIRVVTTAPGRETDRRIVRELESRA